MDLRQPPWHMSSRVCWWPMWFYCQPQSQLGLGFGDWDWGLTISFIDRKNDCKTQLYILMKNITTKSFHTVQQEAEWFNVEVKRERLSSKTDFLDEVKTFVTWKNQTHNKIVSNPTKYCIFYRAQLGYPCVSSWWDVTIWDCDGDWHESVLHGTKLISKLWDLS